MYSPVSTHLYEDADRSDAHLKPEGLTPGGTQEATVIVCRPISERPIAEHPEIGGSAVTLQFLMISMVPDGVTLVMGPDDIVVITSV